MEMLKTLGTALCTAAVATALLGFVSDGTGNGKMIKAASGVYVLLIIITGVAGIDGRELGFDINGAPQSSVQSGGNAAADDAQYSAVLAESERIVSERVEQKLREQGTEASVDCRLYIDEFGAAEIDYIYVTVRESDSAELVRSTVSSLCGAAPTVYVEESEEYD